MIFLSVEDFYKKVESITVLDREDEIDCAKKMRNGDALARKRLIDSYLPMVAAHLKRLPAHLQSLGLILHCQQSLEKAVDSFDFIQNSESFSHRLSWHLRQTVTKYQVE